MRLAKDVFMSAVDFLVLEFAADKACPAFGEVGGVAIQGCAPERNSGPRIGLRRIDPDRPRKCLVWTKKIRVCSLAILPSTEIFPSSSQTMMRMLTPIFWNFLPRTEIKPSAFTLCQLARKA